MKKIYVLLFHALLFDLAIAQTCTPTITASSQYICAGGSATLTATGGTTYTWSANTGGVVTNTVVVTPSSTTSYTVTSSVGGCTDNSSIIIYVNPNPVVTASGCSLCAGNSCSVTATGAMSYTWSSGCVGASCPASPPSTSTFTVWGTDANGCMDSSTAVVTVNPNPVVTITGGSGSTICGGTSVSLCGSGAISYTWYPCNPAGSSFSTPCYTDTPTSSTCYTLVGTDANGCMGTAMTNVTVNAAPSASFTLQADPTPHVWDAYPSFTGGTGPFTYNWNWGDGSTSSAAYPSHSYSVAAFYSICVDITDANGCIASYCENDSVYRMAYNKKSASIIQLNVVNGTMGVKNSESAKTRIYPNPARNAINVSAGSKLSSVTIYDLIGNNVTSLCPTDISMGDASMDISKLQEGIYFVSLKTVNGTSSQKVVVER